MYEVTISDGVKYMAHTFYNEWANYFKVSDPAQKDGMLCADLETHEEGYIYYDGGHGCFRTSLKQIKRIVFPNLEDAICFANILCLNYCGANETIRIYNTGGNLVIDENFDFVY